MNGAIDTSRRTSVPITLKLDITGNRIESPLSKIKHRLLNPKIDDIREHWTTLPVRKEQRDNTHTENIPHDSATEDDKQDSNSEPTEEDDFEWGVDESDLVSDDTMKYQKDVSLT